MRPSWYRKNVATSTFSKLPSSCELIICPYILKHWPVFPSRTGGFLVENHGSLVFCFAGVSNRKNDAFMGRKILSLMRSHSPPSTTPSTLAAEAAGGLRMDPLGNLCFKRMNVDGRLLGGQSVFLFCYQVSVGLFTVSFQHLVDQQKPCYHSKGMHPTKMRWFIPFMTHFCR